MENFNLDAVAEEVGPTTRLILRAVGRAHAGIALVLNTVEK